MQIRRIILISFVLLLSVIALPLMAVLFFSSKYTIESEIKQNLHSDAIMLMQEVDMLMFERMQNVHSWSRMDIIQEAQIGDIDKRLSQFLVDVEFGYKGMYQSLFYINNNHTVIASSSSILIGSSYTPGNKETKIAVPNGEVFIEDLQLPPPPYIAPTMFIRANVKDNNSQQNLGALYGFFNMEQLYNLLDQANSSSAIDRYIVLLDGEGKTIAASANLRKAEMLAKLTFADWRPSNGNTIFVHNGEPITHNSVLVGSALSTGYLGYMQMGWSILIFENTSEAFLPTHSLATIFAIVIIMTVLFAFFASHWLSGIIAKPLLVLTHWVREVRHIEQTLPPITNGAAEVHELAITFKEVLQELEQSREQVIQTAKLAVVGEMSAIMAHEIRTPLGIISTSAQWLQRET
jgi:HAMP domain-containing protein